MKSIIITIGSLLMTAFSCTAQVLPDHKVQEIKDKVSQQADPIISVAPNAEIGALGYYYDAKAVGTLAYEFGYSLVRMEQAMREYTSVPNPKPRTSYRAPLNKIGWAKRLPTAADKDMPTANNDTYYMSAVVDLSEPYILETPNTNGRYFVVNVFDMYHNLVEYIGKRNTGTTALKVALIPEGWEGDLPNDIDKKVIVKTDKAWLWGRIHVLEGENIKKLHLLQDQFKLRSLSESKGYENMNKQTELPEMPVFPTSDSLRFYKYLAFALSQNPTYTEDISLVGQFERIGIKGGKFSTDNLNEHQIKGLKEAAIEAPLAILSSMYSSSVTSNGWNIATKLDNYGYDFPFRSLISGPYLGGQGEKEAMYPIRFIDSDNAPVEGKNSYTITFDEEPPVDSFWSLTLYDATNKLFCDNSLNRYKFSSESKGLKKNKDGSFTIVIQNEEPKNTDNWLPAPKGGFYLIMRLYQPHQSVIDLEYKLPQLIKKKEIL
ncbi:DUF1254 domain-containing protein [Flammeovirga pectinis]|uniref:DUF1254 domain-containing protein n=1 Tax=Flammeovirga pectinis TaxID=2494373 RepID=A0A3Q9FIT3_9BACT|nr:DUF1214 domain-containing protein [Flammeovirga pectinis]AZQ60798.1 DUF1254 domain-containing protein [Flammeovirga pectinis]